MQKERSIKNQLAVVIAVGTVLTACQIGGSAQASQRVTDDLPISKASQTKTIYIRLVEKGQLVDKIVLTGKPGETVPIKIEKRRPFLLVNGDQLSVMPGTFTIPHEGDQVDWTVTRRKLAQKQVHEVVVTLQPEVDQKPIDGAPTQEVRFKVVASYQYDQLHHWKTNIKYQVDPEWLEVVIPQTLPGYESIDTEGIKLSPQELVKSREALALFFDNVDPAPLHFTKASHYRSLANEEDDQQHGKEEQTKSPTEQDQRQPDLGEEDNQPAEKPVDNDNESLDPVDSTVDQTVEETKRPVTDESVQTPVEHPEQVDSSQQTADDAHHAVDESTQTTDEHPEKGDASQQTTAETNNVNNQSESTQVENEISNDVHSETPADAKTLPEEGHKAAAEDKGSTKSDDTLAAEKELLSQLEHQQVPTSANDQLPQTGDSNRGQLIAAIGGLISGLTGLVTAWLFRRTE